MSIGSPNFNRQAKRREATRQEILAAAWEVADEQGIGAVTLREIAERIGMQPPSLYSHFPSKMAIYDAMYQQGWEEYLEVVCQLEPRLPAQPRAALATVAAEFFDFVLAKPTRAQLMNERVVPGFVPTAQAYAPAVAALDNLRMTLTRLGASDEAAADLFTAVLGGLVSQQIANEPGGRRWRLLLERAVDMYADEVGMPGPRLTARTELAGSHS